MTRFYSDSAGSDDTPSGRMFGRGRGLPAAGREAAPPAEIRFSLKPL